MEYVDVASIFSFLALFLGILMIMGGLYARRGGRLRYRQGAAVLAGFTAFLGAAFLAFAFIALLRA